MTHCIPCAPEWEAWFSDPNDASLFHTYAVAFWEYWEDQDGLHVHAYCPNYNEPTGQFVGHLTPHFLYFKSSG